jgi:hypothetical protein
MIVGKLAGQLLLLEPDPLIAQFPEVRLIFAS